MNREQHRAKDLVRFDKMADVCALVCTAGIAVTFIFDEMADTLKDGGTVDINGFGKFTVKNRAGRTGVNPRTGETLEINPSKVPAFKASKTLKDHVK